MSTIRPGQVYVSCEAHWDRFPDERPRIKVTSTPVTTPGMWGFGKVDVVTLTPDGREMRPRRIERSQLHASGTTAQGKPRRTGYRLLQEAPDAD